MSVLKKSVSLSAFDATAPAPVLFNNNLEVNIPLIKKLGYDGVDLFIDDPKSDNSILARRLLIENQLEVGVVMPAALFRQGITLSHSDKKIRAKTIDKLTEIIEYAGSLNAMVSLGLVRGNFDEGGRERFVSSVNELLRFAIFSKVDLLIEPINRYEINNINSSFEALDFITSTNLPLFLMLDTFHMNIEDDDIFDSLIKCENYIKHIHFLDSNRLAPSMGHTDMKKVIETLKNINYNGFLCLEALPKPDFMTCAKCGIEFFKTVGV